MHDHLRHLHELSPGDPFLVGGRASRLLSVGTMRCMIEDPADPEEVAFETRTGRTVAFTRPARGDRPCAPCALVEPIG
jgi:hypothetical protein